MFRLIQNLKIRTRIASALLLPTVGMLVISSFLLVEKWQLASNMGQLEELVKLANHLSRFVHELRKSVACRLSIKAARASRWAKTCRNSGG